MTVADDGRPRSTIGEGEGDNVDVVSWQPVSPGVLQIILQRPPANALGLPVIEGLQAALDHAQASDGLKVLVLSSAVPGFFAAGADIKHMVAADAATFADYGHCLRSLLHRLEGGPHLTIAAVEGMALGGGLELALACTMRVAGAKASFGLPEVKLGLIPGAGGTQRLPRLVGRGRALDMMLTARTVDAVEAAGVGLIDRAVEAGRADAAALALAHDLCGLSMPALRAVVRAVEASLTLPPDQGFAVEADEEQRLFEHGEAREGLAAFVERRPPTFA